MIFIHMQLHIQDIEEKTIFNLYCTSNETTYMT